jgi:hypothetical protein
VSRIGSRRSRLSRQIITAVAVRADARGHCPRQSLWP